MSCLNIITEEARRRGTSAEAKAQRLSWLVPEILGGRQVRRLVAFAQSKSPDVRAVAAAHPSTPVRSLAELCADESVLVRRAVAKNLSTPEPVLNVMLNDEDAGIASYVMYRLDNGLFKV